MSIKWIRENILKLPKLCSRWYVFGLVGFPVTRVLVLGLIIVIMLMLYILYKNI